MGDKAPDDESASKAVGLEIKHYKSTDKLARSKDLITEKVIAGSDSDLFFKRMEIKRLARECHQTIDMRGKVPGQCQEVLHEDKVHWLDDVSHAIFRDGLKSNGGKLTVAIYEAIVNGTHTNKAIREAEERRERLESPPTTPATGDDAPRSADKDAYENRSVPEIVPFGYYRKRHDPRLMYVTTVTTTQGNVSYSGKTRDISVGGIQVVIRTASCPFEAGQILELAFTDLQPQADKIDMSRIAYRVVRTDSKPSEAVLILARVNRNEPPGFSEFVNGFIDKHKHRYKLDPEDEISTVTALYFQRLYASGLTQIPLFLRVNGQGQPCVSRIGVTELSRDFFNFFQTEDGGHDLSALRISQRVQHLCYTVAPAVFRQGNSAPLNRAVGEMVLILYKDKQGQIHSATDFELKNSADKYRMIRHAMVHDQHKILKIFASLVRNHNQEKVNTFSSELFAKSADEAQALRNEVRGMLALAVMTDITEDVRIAMQFMPPTIQAVYDLNGLACWLGNSHRSLSLQSPQELESATLLPPPKQVVFGQEVRRKEERYLARTKVEVEIEGVRYGGTTRDLSVRGLCVILEDKPRVKRGDTLKIGFLSFKKKNYEFDIRNVSYTVVNVEHEDDRLLIMMERDTDRTWREVTDFFKEIIDINRQKLNICVEDVLSTASARLHEDLLATHLLTIPFFLARDESGKVGVQRVAASEYTAVSDNFLVAGGNSLDFRAINWSRFVVRLYDKIKKRARAGTSAVTARNITAREYEAHLYIYRRPGTGSGPPEVFTAADFEFESRADHKAFLNAALESGDYSFWKVVVAPLPQMNKSELDAAVARIHELSRHRAFKFEQDVGNLVGFGELVDITTDLTEALTCEPPAN